MATAQDQSLINLVQTALASGWKTVQSGDPSSGNVALARKSYNYAFSTACQITDPIDQGPQLGQCGALKTAIDALAVDPAQVAQLRADAGTQKQAFVDQEAALTIDEEKNGQQDQETQYIADASSYGAAGALILSPVRATQRAAGNALASAQDSLSQASKPVLVAVGLLGVLGLGAVAWKAAS